MAETSKIAVVRKDDYYVKVVNNNPVTVSSIKQATPFESVKEAQTYINKQIRKSIRNQYRAEPVAKQPEKNMMYEGANIEVKKTNVVSALQQVRSKMIGEMKDLQHDYIDKLQYYENVILDIRHYIRDYNTNLDTQQAANILYRLQRIERKRAEVKRELRRISNIFDSIDDAIKVADDYEYEPYKPRVIDDMGVFLESEEQ